MLGNKIITSDKKISPYIKTLMAKDYTYHRGNLIDDETYISIVYEWIDWFEKNIEKTVNNTFSIYNTLKADNGYDSISRDWGYKNSLTKESMRQHYLDYFIACIAHLYQASHYKDHYQSGATGFNMYCKFDIDFTDSDKKSVEKIVTSNIHMGIDLNCGKYLETEIF